MVVFRNKFLTAAAKSRTKALAEALVKFLNENVKDVPEEYQCPRKGPRFKCIAMTSDSKGPWSIYLSGDAEIWIRISEISTKEGTASTISFVSMANGNAPQMNKFFEYMEEQVKDFGITLGFSLGKEKWYLNKYEFRS